MLHVEFQEVFKKNFSKLIKQYVSFVLCVIEQSNRAWLMVKIRQISISVLLL